MTSVERRSLMIRVALYLGAATFSLATGVLTFKALGATWDNELAAIFGLVGLKLETILAGASRLDPFMLLLAPVPFGLAAIVAAVEMSLLRRIIEQTLTPRPSARGQA